MRVNDQNRRSISTFEGHGVFEARHLGKAARAILLAPELFDALLNALVTEWLEVGYPTEAVTAAQHTALGAYLNGERADERAFDHLTTPIKTRPGSISG